MHRAPTQSNLLSVPQQAERLKALIRLNTGRGPYPTPLEVEAEIAKIRLAQEKGKR